jgi:hypothetical protein
LTISLINAKHLLLMGATSFLTDASWYSSGTKA